MRAANQPTSSTQRVLERLLIFAAAFPLLGCPINYRLVDEYDPVIDDGLVRYYENTIRSFDQSDSRDLEQSNTGEGSFLSYGDIAGYYQSQTVQLKGLLLRAQAGGAASECDKIQEIVSLSRTIKATIGSGEKFDEGSEISVDGGCTYHWLKLVLDTHIEIELIHRDRGILSVNRTKLYSKIVERVVLLALANELAKRGNKSFDVSSTTSIQQGTVLSI